MADDNRLIEIMADLLAEVREMRHDNNQRLDLANERLNRLENQTTRNNAAIGELRLSVMRLADKIEEIYHLDQRVKVLESIVLPKPPLQQAA